MLIPFNLELAPHWLTTSHIRRDRMMKIRNVGIFAVLLVLISAGVAFAQVAGEPDPAGLLSQLIAALGSGGYLVAALLVTALIVWVAEHFLPKFVPVLGKPIPSALLALGMSMIVPVINAAIGGGLTLTEVFGALSVGFTAWGGLSKLISLFTSVSTPSATDPKPSA